MFARSHKLSALVTAAAAVAVAAFAIPASADSGSCTPPAGADGWYCAALSMSNGGSADRLVDDYFRDPPARRSTCTPPAGADGWYCAALSMNNASAPKSVTASFGYQVVFARDTFRRSEVVVAPAAFTLSLRRSRLGISAAAK